MLRLAVLEELNLAQALFGSFESLVGPAEVPALTGDDLIPTFCFLDHSNFRPL